MSLPSDGQSGRDARGCFANSNYLQSRPILSDPAVQAELLELVKLGFSLRKSCELSGIEDLHTLRDHRKRDPDFDRRLREAMRGGLKLAAVRYLKCLNGNGDKVTLDAAKHMLACRDPEHWAKTSKHEITGKDGGAIQTQSTLDLSALSDDDLDRFSELLGRCAQRRGEGEGEPGGQKP